MKVNSNVSLYVGADYTNQNGRPERGQKNGGRQVNAVCAAFLGGQFDPIEQKRALAKKQVQKIIGDTYAGERKLDNDLKERASRIGDYYADYAKANRTIRDVDDKKEALREEYGVEMDSQEQDDLEFLERYERYKRGVVDMVLTPQELQSMMERGKELEDRGYTEYQQRALDMDAFKDIPMVNRRDALQGIYEEAGTIRGMQLERLKKDPMLKAQKQAEEILESVSDEIIGMLVDEAKDTIDEKNEEELEKAKDNKEEKKEELEKLEEAKERREEMEALADPEHAKKKENRPDQSELVLGDPITEGLLRMDNVRNDVKQEIADIMLKMKLVAEDFKGIEIDELL